ncbi:MAG: ABC transporter ATP-binding protein [Verrucomicrobia bacterium]|nr:ABC transporter ATP-binding protein [Verrucomicrobiota bacterium]
MHCAHCGHHHELNVSGVRVRYRNILALDDVSLATSCGACVALIGPNGAGKSTLLKAIAGLIPLESGGIVWRGAKVAKWSREIAYLPQRENVDWNFPVTVRGVVRMGRYPQTGWWRPFKAADEAAVDKALADMDLTDLHNRQISELSGGQQQRVFLARALTQEAHVLLLDEPFTGLDRTTKATLAATLRRLAGEGRLIIASHHDLETVRDIYDEALLLRRSPVAYGPVGEVFNETNLALTFGPAAPSGKEVA